jgi:hypothetical protein
MSPAKNSRFPLIPITILALALTILGAPGSVWSSMRDEIRQFHDFLQDHPKVSTELRMNPNLVNNKKYLDQHDDLEKFLKRHPAVKREILHHPSRVFGRYYRDDRYAR